MQPDREDVIELRPSRRRHRVQPVARGPGRHMRFPRIPDLRGVAADICRGQVREAAERHEAPSQGFREIRVMCDRRDDGGRVQVGQQGLVGWRSSMSYSFQGFDTLHFTTTLA